MKIILAITNYHLKSLLRNFKSASIMFILPVVFISLFGFVFKENEVNFTVGIVKEDYEAYTSFKNVIEEIRQSDDDNKKLFKIIEFDTKQEAESAIKSDKINIFLEIDEDFFPGKSGTIQTYGESTSSTFNAVNGIIVKIAAEYLQKDINFVSTNYVDVQASNKFSAFDYLAPGLIVYAILILLPGIAQSFTEITEKGYVFRYFTSKASSTHIITGTTLYYMILVIIQLMLTFLTASIVGFKSNGSIIQGMIIALPTGLFVVGLGILIGSYVKKADSATNLGSLLSIVLGFLSGSFIAGIGNIWKFELFGQTIQFNDFLATKWATVAMERTLRDGEPLVSSFNALLFITVSAVVLLVIGAFVYTKRQLRGSL